MHTMWESHQIAESTLDVSVVSPTSSHLACDDDSQDDSHPQNLREAQLSDPGINFVLRAKESNDRPSVDLTKSKSLEIWKLLLQWDQLAVQNSLLACKFEQEGRGVTHQWIVPHSQRKEILHQLHGGPTGAHLGKVKTLGKLRESFYWPGHADDVKKWCSACEMYEQRKHPTP